ncbi:NlpC/P60 family protein [Enterobacter sp. R1(2018)]|uniref:NlpC/P60 family protein n=1 Tax=Enterobacter sp. R1(2018) TaxID=2447891 RepID=UPI000EB1458C|nr:NlpC/P60 family protein [Enterobacter sp. R1(2018)]RKQ38408.1 peptidoglycan endopeptidase [Enterobacter sp. R1(2018)]
MLKEEFLDKVIGLPWRNRACSFDAVDCWGLVILYHRNVLGIELHHSPDYESGEDFMTCFESEVVYWQPAEHFSDGDIFIAYYGAQPVHVGLIVDGRALHSRGECGSVRSDQIRTIQKLFTRVEWYSYAGNRNTESAGAAKATDACVFGDRVQRVA